MFYNGYNVYVDDIACTSVKQIQVKFPRSKKKRIRKKWSKNKKNFIEKIEKNIYVMEDKKLMIVTSEVYNQLQQLNDIKNQHNYLFMPKTTIKNDSFLISREKMI